MLQKGKCRWWISCRKLALCLEKVVWCASWTDSTVVQAGTVAAAASTACASSPFIEVTGSHEVFAILSWRLYCVVTATFGLFSSSSHSPLGIKPLCVLSPVLFPTLSTGQVWTRQRGVKMQGLWFRSISVCNQFAPLWPQPLAPSLLAGV